MPTEQDAGRQFAEAVAIMARLRAPGGCPWDREQTFDSIRKYTLEETYEVFDAIERRDWAHLKEELGDLLLQVLFYSEMAAEAGDFSISDVIAGLNRKLIRRQRLRGMLPKDWRRTGSTRSRFCATGNRSNNWRKILK